MKAQVPSVVRPCQPLDFEAMYVIINDAARACRGVIPSDCWHDPYMSREELAHDNEDRTSAARVLTPCVPVSPDEGANSDAVPPIPRHRWEVVVDNPRWQMAEPLRERRCGGRAQRQPVRGQPRMNRQARPIQGQARMPHPAQAGCVL